MWWIVCKCYLGKRMKINQVASIIRPMVQFEGGKTLHCSTHAIFRKINLRYWELHHCLCLQLYYFFKLISSSTHASISQMHRPWTMPSWSKWMDKREDSFYIIFILDIYIYILYRGYGRLGPTSCCFGVPRACRLPTYIGSTDPEGDVPWVLVNGLWCLLNPFNVIYIGPRPSRRPMSPLLV